MEGVAAEAIEGVGDEGAAAGIFCCTVVHSYSLQYAARTLVVFGNVPNPCGRALNCSGLKSTQG